MPIEDLKHIRGMSDPMGFQFNLLDKGRRMLIHAVIFTSYEVACGDRVVEFPTVEKDLRLKAFIHYLASNYAKEIGEIEKDLATKKAQLEAMSIRLKQLDRSIQKEETKHE